MKKVFALVINQLDELVATNAWLSEGFEGYVLEVGYLKRNFAIDEEEAMEISSFLITAEKFQKFHNHEITTEELLRNSVILVDGEGIEQ